MDQMQALQQAIALLWPELPALVGNDWPHFERELQTYLAQLATATDAEQSEVIYDQIRLLFFDHAAADARLIELLAQSNRESLAFTTKGLETPASTASPIPTDALSTVTRYTDIVAPVAVMVQTRFPLIVGLTRTPAPDSIDAQAIDALVGAAIRVVITSIDFEIIGKRVKQIVVQAEADSEPVVFYLRAPRVGMGTVLIDFWYGGQIVASNKRTIKAQAELAVVTNERATAQPLVLEPPQAPYPDLILRVTTAGNRLQYNLSFADIQFLHFEGEPLRSDPEKFRYDLIKEIETLANQVGPSDNNANDERHFTSASKLGDEDLAQEEDFVIRQLEEIGRWLYLTLFPLELRREYRRFRGQVRTFQIISDEPWIPWELLKPYDDEDPQQMVDDDFLCLQFEFARWFTPARAPAQMILVESLACITPTDSGLPAAIEEQKMVRNLAVAHRLIDCTPASPTLSAMQQLLTGDRAIQLWHFACHGDFKHDTPDQSPLLLQGKSPFRPRNLVGRPQTRLKGDRPIIFLNACRVGASGLALTGLGGWAKVMIQDCGVGAFLAPMWTVDDQLAQQFATVFYTTLLTPDTTFAQAVHAARQAVRTAAPNNPIWLAYSVYAHPNARVHL